MNNVKYIENMNVTYNWYLYTSHWNLLKNHNKYYKISNKKDVINKKIKVEVNFYDSYNNVKIKSKEYIIKDLSIGKIEIFQDNRKLYISKNLNTKINLKSIVYGWSNGKSDMNIHVKENEINKHIYAYAFIKDSYNNKYRIKSNTILVDNVVDIEEVYYTWENTLNIVAKLKNSINEDTIILKINGHVFK